jgi:hypothetical protein
MGVSSRHINPVRGSKGKKEDDDAAVDVEGGYDEEEDKEMDRQATSGVSSNMNLNSGTSARQRPQANR